MHKWLAERDMILYQDFDQEYIPSVVLSNILHNRNKGRKSNSDEQQPDNENCDTARHKLQSLSGEDLLKMHSDCNINQNSNTSLQLNSQESSLSMEHLEAKREPFVLHRIISSIFMTPFEKFKSCFQYVPLLRKRDVFIAKPTRHVTFSCINTAQSEQVFPSVRKDIPNVFPARTATIEQDNTANQRNDVSKNDSDSDTIDYTTDLKTSPNPVNLVQLLKQQRKKQRNILMTAIKLRQQEMLMLDAMKRRHLMNTSADGNIIPKVAPSILSLRNNLLRLQKPYYARPTHPLLRHKSPRWQRSYENIRSNKLPRCRQEEESALEETVLEACEPQCKRRRIL